MNPYSGDRLRGAEAAARALAMSKKEKEKGEDTDVVPRRPGRGQPEQSGRTEPQPADAAPSAAAAASSSSSARPGASRPSPAERPWASLAADRAPAMAVNSRASTKPKPTMGFFDSDPLVLRPRERRLSPQQELIDMGEGDEPMGPVGFPGMENVTTVLLRRPGRFLFEPINPEGRPAEGGAHMTAENRLQRSLVIRLWSLQLGAPLRLPRRDELLSISREIVESRLAHAQGLVRSRNDSLRLLGAGEHHPPLHFRRDLGTPGALFGGGNPPADPSIFVPPTRLADPRAEERARETADPATGKGENRRLVEFYDDLKRLYGASPGEAVEWDEESEEGVRRLFSDHLLPFFFAAVGIPPALSLHVLNRRQRNGGDQQQQGGDEETDDPREIPIPPLPSEWVPVGEWMHLRRGEIVRMVRHILQAVVHVGDFTTRQQNQRHQPSPAPRVTVRIGRHSTVVQESASAAASASSSSSHPSSSPPASAGSSSSPSPVPPPAAASRGSQLDPNAPPFVPSARPPAVTHRPPPPAYSAFAAPLPPTASAPKHHVPLSRPVTRSSYRLSGRTMAAPPPPGASAFASLSSASLIAHPHSHGGNPTPSPRNAWLHFILAWLNNSLTLDHLNRASGLLRSEGRALRAALISGRDARRVQEEWQETEDALERREWEDVVSLGGRVHLPSGGHNEGVLGISGSGAITPPYPRGGAGAETPSSSVSPASSSSTAHQPPQKQQRTVERERSESETEGQRDDIPMQEGDRDRLLAAPAASATVERFRPLVSAMSLPTAPTQGEEEEGGDPMDDAEMEDVEEEGAGEGVGSGTQRVKRKREVRVPGAKGAPPVQAEGAASAAASSSSSASASTHSFFATRSTTAGSSVSASVPLSLAGAAAATAAAAGVPLTTSKSKSGQEKGAAASSSSSSNPQSLSKAGSKGRKK
uniref:Uncharacterized protein n=1 Tax=Chromera velia CCMP2878 TaxID=1169474 RepID=A0A0K6S6S1_9ALVE|eukprot:Cvel_18690.t1-p1 / transcript=Cvel_18690.t1 / gene=Cvel_18690 / organism=Chromera_velia_CCMP2878 / gene_product=hypothetical protein / transcript_product=hypothetical protein / location=Cvel_scaffold1564:31365-34151(-) / protein_length=929 / sequence_SO=supercontig / SO=protein_coding / is_pseudo=false